MNYQQHYNNLVSKAKSRSLIKGTYIEKHHILPRSMGGDDSLANIVKLTAKEHYVAHHLLWKIYKNQSMACAFWRMSHVDVKNRPYKINSITYENIRKDVSRYAKTRMMSKEMKVFYRDVRASWKLSDESKQKISLALTGRKQSKELIEKRSKKVKQYMQENRTGKTWEEIYGENLSEKMRIEISNANKGKILTDLHKENISKGNTGKILSEKTKEKISSSNKGKIRSEETKKQISISHLGKKLSEEQKKKISTSTKGKLKTEETKKKMSETKKGKLFTEAHKQKLREAAKNRKKRI